MCLIIVKKRGVSVTAELYRSIARSYNLRNRDGLGFAIKKLDKIYISKGYEDLSDFIHALKSHSPKKSDELIIHLRKVSAGQKSIENCHPYVCSQSIDEVTTEEGYVDRPVVAHNGTISLYTYSKIYSDTVMFILEKLGKLGYPRVLKYLNKEEPQLVSSLIGTSKLAIMFPMKETIGVIGRGWITEKNGLIFSNTSYLGDNCPTHGKRVVIHGFNKHDMAYYG
jgi:hypothetical protein